MGDDGGRLDVGVADQQVEVAAQRAHVLDGRQHEVQVAEYSAARFGPNTVTGVA